LFTSENLAEANKCADALASKLEQSESARKKAEADAASVEDLRKRLHDAETSLSEHITEQSVREAAIIKRLESQNRRFVSKCPSYFAFLAFLYSFVDQLIFALTGKTSQEYELEDPDNDPLLDALSFLEFHGDEAREGLE
jgi:hypothetical protein